MPKKALSQKKEKVKENPDWSLQEVNRFGEKMVTELSHFSGNNRVGGSAKGGEFRIIVGLGYSHSWRGRSQQDALCLQDFLGTAAITVPRAVQSKWGAASKCLLDGQELQIPH